MIFKIGQKASFTKTVTESDVVTYAGITGDFNPAHINEEYAKDTFFKTRIAHGMLTAGFISAVLGTKFPGPGTIYMGQTLQFLAPVYIGDTICAQVELKEIGIKNKAVLKTVCTNQNGIEVLIGEATVKLPKE